MTTRATPGQSPGELPGLSVTAGGGGSESLSTVPAAPTDHAWLEDVFRMHARFVANTLRRFGIAAVDVPDQVQEVFLAVFGARTSFDASRPIRPWLFGFAYRIAGRYRRARGRGGATEDVDDVDLADDRPLADRALETKEAQALALAALERVELSRRAVFVMADLEGEPIPAIAEVLEIPLNTAYSRLRLAREEFAQAARRLKRRAAGPGGDA